MLAVRAVVGHDDDLIAGGTNLVFQYDELLATTSNDADNLVAGSLQRLYDGQHGSCSHATTGTEHGAVVLDVCGTTQRTDHVCYIIAFVQRTELAGAGTNGLNDKGYRSFLFVAACNGEGHTFALLVHADNNEMTCLACLGNQRCLNVQTEYLLAELNFLYNLEHSLNYLLSLLCCLDNRGQRYKKNVRRTSISPIFIALTYRNVLHSTCRTRCFHVSYPLFSRVVPAVFTCRTRCSHVPYPLFPRAVPAVDFVELKLPHCRECAKPFTFLTFPFSPF